ncbi:MAG TPA: hypothetical protein HPQ04_13445 [Rhodospirillaceae bacterium]|nr:hypothetical protein [Rhodospirillaceae bacterium]
MDFAKRLIRPKGRRFFYADPGLKDKGGHHAGYCRAIVDELLSRGLQTEILAFAGISRELQQELGAVPFFRAYTYWTTDGDPICGWLNRFDKAVQETVEDLERLDDLNNDDIVFLISVQAAQLMAAVQWLDGLEPRRRPRVMVDFVEDAGLDAVPQGNGVAFATRDPRMDPRAVLYRFAGSQMANAETGSLRLFAAEQWMSVAYSFLLKRPVELFPTPQVPFKTVTNRVGRRPITLAVLGYQRAVKGYSLVPDIVEMLLAANADIRFLAHNSNPVETGDLQARMRQIAERNPRLTLDERVLQDDQWAEVLERVDIILCPYNLFQYAACCSGVAFDALANGIPLVMPKGSSLERLVEEFGSGGTVFEAHAVDSIVEAALRAVAGFDDMAAKSFQAAGKWAQQRGPKASVDTLLSIDPVTTEGACRS